jgi:hypothetical protein
MKIELTVPWSEAGVRIACIALTALNRLILQAGPQIAGKPFPPLYASGVRYQRQPGPERFLPIPLVMRRKHGDCDQLACWRAAELQEQGIKARAVPRFVAPRTMHVIVVWPDGSEEDPSKRLGMGGSS